MSPCFIYCQEEDSCLNANIFCPLNLECSISCGKSSNACNGLLIDARYSSSFSLNDCSSGDRSTCNGVTIYFPPNNFGTKRGFINTGNNLKNSLIFYAIYGWLDIDTSGFIGDYNDNLNGIMYCTFWYNINCQFNDKNFSCKNTNDLCNNPLPINPPSKETTQDITIPFTSTIIGDREISTQRKPATNYVITTNNNGYTYTHSLWYILAALIICLCILAVPLMYYVNRHYKYYKKAVNAEIYHRNQYENNNRRRTRDKYKYKKSTVLSSKGEKQPLPDTMDSNLSTSTPSTPSTPSTLSAENMGQTKMEGNILAITRNNDKEKEKKTELQQQNSMSTITEICTFDQHLHNVKPTHIDIPSSRSSITKIKRAIYEDTPYSVTTVTTNNNNTFINDVGSDSNTLYVDNKTNLISTCNFTGNSNSRSSSNTDTIDMDDIEQLTVKVISDINDDNMSHDTWISFYQSDLYNHVNHNEHHQSLYNDNYVD